jgi:hypothetical protein
MKVQSQGNTPIGPVYQVRSHQPARPDRILIPTLKLQVMGTSGQCLGFISRWRLILGAI